MFCILNLLPGMTQYTHSSLFVTLPIHKQTNNKRGENVRNALLAKKIGHIDMYKKD